MSIIITAIFVFLVIYSYIFRKYNILLFLLLLSLFNDIFEFSIGVAFKMHHFIVLLSLPGLIIYYYHSIKLKKITKYLFVEFLFAIMLGVVFGFITPFDDTYANSRLFTQTPAMRATISTLRMLLELSTIIIIIYWINTKKIFVSQIVKFISIVIIINVIVAIIDYLGGYFIKTLIYPDVRIITGRFTGLSGEPKAFGRYCSFSLLYLLYFNNTKSQTLRKLAIAFSSLGVLLSLSASTILITTAGLSIYLLSRRRIKSTIIIVTFSIIAYSFLNVNVFFKSQTLFKIQTAIGVLDDTSIEKVNIDEPEFFSRFDVFDRAALNFLYNNPKYLLFGVGPNLISTPASEYLTPTAASIYTEGINTAPGTYLISTLSRTGIVGIVLNILFFSFVLKSIKNKSDKYFFITFWIMTLMVGTSLFYFFNGFIIALIIKRRNHLQKYMISKIQIK